MGGGWQRERISLDFLAIGRAHGLSARQVEELWERLSDDPRFHLAPDPERWRRAAFVRAASALTAPHRETEERPAVPGRGPPHMTSAGNRTHPAVPGRWSPHTTSVAGKRTLVEDLAEDTTTAPSAGELPHRAEFEAMFGTSFADVRAFTNQDRLLAPHNAGAAAFRGGVAFAGTPSKALVAHELVHVRQLQTAGVTVNAGAAEDQADA